jgi:hypothetical protein
LRKEFLLLMKPFYVTNFLRPKRGLKRFSQRKNCLFPERDDLDNFHNKIKKLEIENMRISKLGRSARNLIGLD